MVADFWFSWPRPTWNNIQKCSSNIHRLNFQSQYLYWITDIDWIRITIFKLFSIDELTYNKSQVQVVPNNTRFQNRIFTQWCTEVLQYYHQRENHRGLGISQWWLTDSDSQITAQCFNSKYVGIDSQAAPVQHRRSTGSTFLLSKSSKSGRFHIETATWQCWQYPSQTNAFAGLFHRYLILPKFKMFWLKILTYATQT